MVVRERGNIWRNIGTSFREGVKVRRAHRNAKDNGPEAKVQFRVTFRVRFSRIPVLRCQRQYRWHPGYLVAPSRNSPVHTPLITLVKGTPLFPTSQRFGFGRGNLGPWCPWVYDSRSRGRDAFMVCLDTFRKQFKSQQCRVHPSCSFSTTALTPAHPFVNGWVRDPNRFT